MPRMPRRLGHGESVTLVDHLTELRTRLVIGFGAVAFFFIFTYAFRKTLVRWLREPVPDNYELTTLSPGEPFITSFTVSLYAAIALAIPVLVWQLWAFLAPAFEVTSQRVVVRLVGAATVLLVSGMAFAYWIVLPRGIPFLLAFDSELYDVQLRAREYFNFASIVILASGLLFELPIFILGLVRLGILTSARLRTNRRIGYGLCLISAVLLPGVDFVTMALQALPILVLFEGSIWASVYFEKRWAARGELGAPLVGTSDT